MTQTCAHSKTRTLSTEGFARDVSVHPYTESNPAAHGNITERVECTACGARRLENINGRHVEVSPWRGSYAERDAAVQRARDAVRSTRPTPVTFTRASDGETATVSVDTEGRLVVDAPTFAARKAILGALPVDFAEAYEAHSAAMNALRAAEGELS